MMKILYCLRYEVIVQVQRRIPEVSKWAIPFKILTPPVEDCRRKVYHVGVKFQMHLTASTFCVMFRSGYRRGSIFIYRSAK